MSDRAIIEALGRQIVALRGSYSPRPTPWDGLSVEDSQAMSEQWITTLVPFGAPTVMEAIDQWKAEKTPWFPSLNDLVMRCAEINKRRELAKQLRMPVSRIVHCDGSGWTSSPEGWSPCPRCNPFLAELYGDRRGWKRYREGASLHLLNSQVQYVLGRLEAPESNPMPAPCEIVEDPEVRYPTFAEGVAIAREAYITEAARLGKEINMKHFNATVGAVPT